MVSDNLVMSKVFLNIAKRKRMIKVTILKLTFSYQKQVITERIKWENICNTYHKRGNSLIYKRLINQ